MKTGTSFKPDTIDISSPAKILFVLECWHTGGTESHVRQLGTYLRANGIGQISVVVLGEVDNELLETETWVDEWFLVKFTARNRFRELGRVIRAIAPDIVHLHLYSSLLAVTTLLRIMGIDAMVTTLHMPLTHWNLRHRLMWRLALRCTRFITGVSYEVIRSLGPNTANAVVISPPYPIGEAELRHTKVDHEIFTIAGCGRLAPEKDWPTLLRAFACLKHKVNVPVGLVLIGEGPLEKVLKEQAQSLNIEREVRFLGRLPHGEVLSQLRSADLFVLPSLFEGLGMVALEAMHCGVPTITSDFPASTEFITHGVTGHRFRRGDSDALFNLLLWHYENRSESRNIGLNGQQFIGETFSEEKTFAKYTRVYAQACGKPCPADV